MRALVSAILFLAPAIAGANASASGLIEVCHLDRDKVELDLFEMESKFYTGHEERNLTIRTWLETASRKEIIDIWGDPSLTSDMLRWEIPSEIGQYVSKRIFERNDNYCFYKGVRQFTFIVEEPLLRTSETDRTITQMVKLGSPSFKQKEKN